MSNNEMYGEVCIGTNFRLRKYPELRKVAQHLRNTPVICSKDAKAIVETPDICPVRLLVGLNYNSRFPFTTKRLENDRVDHWSYVRPVTIQEMPIETLICGILNLEAPNRMTINALQTEEGLEIIGNRISFNPEPGKKHLPEEEGKIYYITRTVAGVRFINFMETLVLPYVQKHLKVKKVIYKSEHGKEFVSELKCQI